jgi:ribosomal protein S18 acetylase RimI-like enzyme
MEIRQAKQNDTGAIAEMIYSSGADIYDFIYKTRNKTALDYINYEFKSGRGFAGFKNVTVAIENNEVIATGCFYDGNVYNKLVMGTALNMFLFYGLINFGTVLKRSLHAISVMKQPRKNKLYLSNFGVSKTERSKGIGSTIVKKKITEAKIANYKKFILDVSVNNPKAETLYKRMGMNVTKEKKFTGKRDGFECADARQMELVLNN